VHQSFSHQPFRGLKPVCFRHQDVGASAGFITLDKYFRKKVSNFDLVGQSGY
jgi:hypothetical protein